MASYILKVGRGSHAMFISPKDRSEAVAVHSYHDASCIKMHGYAQGVKVGL